MDLFDATTPSPKIPPQPLAARMRPRTLDEFVGQEQIVGAGKLLRRAIEADRLTSVILYGPPGTGKTALAHVIANTSKAHIERLNAVMDGVAELRQAIARAKERARRDGKKTILFIDEIHRFNKTQQDALMPDVESGNPVLIGATAFNPFFALVAPLLSRSIVVEFKPHSAEDVTQILHRALQDTERGLGRLKVAVLPEALAQLAALADGDARRALNALELAVLTTTTGPDGAVALTQAVLEESLQKKAVVYDKTDDAHYDTASAFIKSMRGSDPDAALYWLAKMLYAGEDPRFIARRIVICAAEDVGNADPQALVVATAAMQAAEFVGLPECKIPLAQAVTYIACAPKSNAAYLGISQAMRDVEQGRTLEVPTHLKDAHYPGAKRLGHGQGYQYAHDSPDHFAPQDYLGAAPHYYQPTGLGFEQVLKERLEAWRQRRSQAAKPPPDRPHQPVSKP